MTVIGITGPSGAGKGAVSIILREKYSFHIIDADSIYHSLVSAPSPCLEEITLHFGSCVINENGALDRKALSPLVFGIGNEDKLLLLNKITHKYVIEKILSDIEHCKARSANCVVDAPLLFEADLQKYCDFTISVIADEKSRIERIVTRDNISKEKAMERISSQKSDDYYTSRANYVINNNGDISLLESSVAKMLSERSVAT